MDSLLVHGVLSASFDLVSCRSRVLLYSTTLITQSSFVFQDLAIALTKEYTKQTGDILVFFYYVIGTRYKIELQLSFQ